MIGIDTNVLVRYITQDDKKQAARANQLIDRELNASNPGYITLVTLVEIVWVLESCYQQPKSQIVEILKLLLTTRQLVVQDGEVVYLALKKFDSGVADFSDALVVALSDDRGCEKTVTFDKKAKTVGMIVL